MPAININLDADEINEHIKTAIIESMIGEALKKIIESQISDLTNSYNNPLKPVVEKAISDIVYNLLKNEYGDKLEALVKEQLTDEVLTGLAKTAVQNVGIYKTSERY